MGAAVLALRTQPDAIGERGLEPIEIGADDIHVLVLDQTRQVLPHALWHDARLAVMNSEAFFHQDGSHVRREQFDSPFKHGPSPGERKIIRVARVFGPNRFRQT
jgi:hypothetical protein